MTADSGYRAPAQSVTTFVFKGVTPEAVENGSNPENPGGHAAVKDFDFSVYHPSETPEEPVEPTTPDELETPGMPEKTSALPYILAGAGVLLVLAVAVIVIAAKKKKK